MRGLRYFAGARAVTGQFLSLFFRARPVSFRLVGAVFVFDRVFDRVLGRVRPVRLQQVCIEGLCDPGRFGMPRNHLNY
jgi:hypothetical protein